MIITSRRMYVEWTNFSRGVCLSTHNSPSRPDYQPKIEQNAKLLLAAPAVASDSRDADLGGGVFKQRVAREGGGNPGENWSR
jgi:hypothetical protein